MSETTSSTNLQQGSIRGCWKLLESYNPNQKTIKSTCIICNKTEQQVSVSVLKKGKSKHCGCLGRLSKIYVGFQKNNFEVVEIKNYPAIRIKCLGCGFEKEQSYLRFLNRKLTKCNNCFETKKSQIHVGDKKGFLEVLAVKEGRKLDLKCHACGTTTEKDYVCFLRGEIKSCGCKRVELKINTLREKLGVDHYSQSEQFKVARKKEIVSKSNQTKRKNGNLVLLSDGRSLYNLCIEQEIPPAFVLRLFKEQGEAAALSYLENYKGRKVFWTTEQAFIDLVKDDFPNIQKWDRQPLEFKLDRRPDFRLEKNGKICYINLDGLYTHSNLNLENNYHYQLRENFTNNNSRIFQFREDELRDKAAIVRSIVLNYFDCHQKIYNARSLKIRQVSSKEASDFFENNHLMGRYKSAKAFGLYDNETLISCMSVRKKDSSIEIARFGSKIDCKVRGGFSKLLHFIEKTFKPKQIISFCDFRYSSGISYEICNFKLEGISLGWSWTDFKSTFNRLRCRANMDDRKLTQDQQAKEFGWVKIYDAGQGKYLKTIEGSSK